MRRTRQTVILLTFLGAVACGDDDLIQSTPVDGGLGSDLSVADPNRSDATGEPDAPADSTGDVDAEMGDATTGPLDSDLDGLTDDEELDIGTDPDDEDSDDDGFWDGWEVTEGTDPNDETDMPDLVLPEGHAYALEMTGLEEPAGLQDLFNAALSAVPPVILFVDGLTDGSDDDPVLFVGGLGQPLDPGADDDWGTNDDQFGLDFSSRNQLDGSFFIDRVRLLAISNSRPRACGRRESRPWGYFRFRWAGCDRAGGGRNQRQPARPSLAVDIPR